MAQSVAYVTGFETGDASEVNSLGGSCTIQSTTKRTGGYALQVAQSSGVTIFVTGLAATQSVFHGYVRFSGTVGSGTPSFVREAPSSGTARLTLAAASTMKLTISDNGSSLGLGSVTGSTVLVANTWYCIEVALDLAAGGVVKVWIDGVSEISTTHTTNATANPIDRWQTNNGPSDGINIFLDDIRIDTGGAAQIGAGQGIARQGIPGTPTYDAWTKNGAATAALCWSDTPVNTATNCSDTSLSAFQTMLINTFANDPGIVAEGTQVIGLSDTINAVKVMLIGKSSVVAGGAGAFNIRSRVGGVDTDSAKTFTTSDAFYSTLLASIPSYTNLNAMEAGAGHGGVAATQTVEDVWVYVDYTPAAVKTSPTRGLLLMGFGH